MQDKQGFLWFGTKDGLNRFDGYQFKIFRSDPASKNSLGGNFIRCLFEEPNGNMWIGTDRGIYKYNQLNESFSKLEVSPLDEIRDIKTDDKQNLWFIAGFTLYQYNRSTNKLNTFAIADNFEATSICISSGTVWISTSTGTLEMYDSVFNSFKSYPVFNTSRPAVSKLIERLYDTGKNSLLVGTSKQGVKLFDLSTYKYKDLPLYNEDKSEIFAREFISNSKDEYWIATESGIFIYELSSGKYVNLTKKYNDPYSISDNASYTLCIDKEGGIWVGSYFGGLSYYSKQYATFEKSFPKVGENSISGNAVREILKDKYNNVWIGTEDGGLNKLEINDGNFSNFKPDGSKNSISHINIHGLLATGDTLWIGTFENGLDLMRISTGKVIKHYSTDNPAHSFKSNFIYSIYQTRTGRILFATARGLHEYNRKKQGFDLLEEVPTAIFYTTIFEDSKGTIWVGSYRDGLFYFNPKTKNKGVHKYVPGTKNSLSNNRVNSIIEGRNSEMWLGTEGGLCKFDTKKGHYTTYNIKNGFPSDVLFAILEDNQQQLWISTSKGLVCFNPRTNNLKVFTKANGLLSDQFNYNSAYKDSQGIMFFGCVKGMISFNPAQFIKNTFTPPIYITGFQVNNRELEISKDQLPLKKSITFTDTLSLKYDQSSFSIDFAALSYTSPEMTQYRYKMEGLYKDWIYLKSNRKVYFTGLSPGKYLFKIAASNSSGVWNKKERLLLIHISPPFWASNWAYSIYTVLLLSIIFYVFRSYHKRVGLLNRRKIAIINSRKEKEIYEAKIAFFTNVAHEIRTPLTLIIGPMEKIMKKSEEVPLIQNNLRIMEKNTNRLLELTNQLLDFRKTEINGFNLNFVKADISELLTNTFTRFKAVTQQKKIRYKLELPTGKQYAYVDKEALNKILSNLIDNAFKYAKSKVTVVLLPIDKAHTVFTIRIKNDGHIIQQALKNEIFETFYRMKETEKLSGTGIGLPLSRSLAELHKGSLDLIATENEMNVFELTLPVHQQIEFNLR